MGSFLSSQSQLPPASSSVAPVPAATASPQWFLLAPYGGGYGEACNVTGDSKTIADAATSNGMRIRVSLRREPFPALSRICLYYLPGTAYRTWASSTVIAAHGGSVLVHICSSSYALDYFVYSNVSAAAADPARPPSLYLLPAAAARWRLDVCATGLLCRGEADFVVAELTIVGSKVEAAKAAMPITFELRLFRHGEWSVKRPWIIHGRGVYGKQLRAQWETVAVVPLGNGMLCWVDRYSGVIFSDVLEEGLRYVPYPAEAVMYQSFICTNVRGALKLVSMSPHRCSHCGCSEHATDFDIWTLKTDDMAWVLETKTNMVDTTELWMLPDAPGYARIQLVYPVASMNEGGHAAASMNGGGDHVSDESAAPMEEEDEHMRLRVSTPSASTGDQLEGEIDNGLATVAGGPRGSSGPIQW